MRDDTTDLLFECSLLLGRAVWPHGGADSQSHTRVAPPLS